MIADESPFRRLPAALEARQALYLDGIRHAAEIAHMAYFRLKRILTEIALVVEEKPNRILITTAFSDAWTFVDAADRFRTMWNAQPNIEWSEPSVEEKEKETFQNIRRVRNVADHLAQRVDYLIAHRSAALGALTWTTVKSTNPLSALMCTIIPGTLQRSNSRAPSFSGKEVELPTGWVHIQIGEHLANLSVAYASMRSQIQAHEIALKESFDSMGITEFAPTDAIIRMEFIEKNETDLVGAP